MKKNWPILEIIVSLSFFIMLLVTFLGVLTRYVFNRPVIFNEELARILLIDIVLIGAIINSRNKNQLRVDFFYKLLFSSKFKKKVDLILDIIIILGMAALVYYGVLLVFISKKQYTTVLHIPWTIIYSIIPFFSLIILFYHLKEILSLIRNYKK